METPMSTQIEQAAAAADFGEPTARKAGRDTRWPYVPVLLVEGRQAQIRGLAYETRAEAVEAAERHITAARRTLAARLAEPRCRALREQYGLPRDIR
jgi:hypothetical protein